MGYHLWFHRGFCEWNSVHYEGFQGKKSSGYNVPGNFPGGIFIKLFKSFEKSANHLTRLMIQHS